MKTFQMTNPFTYEKEDAVLKVGAYASDPAVMAVQVETPEGEPLTTASVNLGPDAGNQSVIRMGSTFLDTNNNPAIAQDFEDAGLAKPYERWGEAVTKDSGWASYPLYEFDMKKLAEYDPEGVKTYEDGYEKGFEKALPEVTGEMWFDDSGDEKENAGAAPSGYPDDPMDIRKEMADRYHNLSAEESEKLSDEERSDLALAAQEEAEDAAWERSMQSAMPEKTQEKEAAPDTERSDDEAGPKPQDTPSASHKDTKDAPASDEKSQDTSDEKPKARFAKLWVPSDHIETKDGSRGKFDEIKMPLPGHKVDSLTFPHKKNAPEFHPDASGPHKDVLIFLPKDRPLAVKEYDQVTKTRQKLTKSADEVVDIMKESRAFTKNMREASASKESSGTSKSPMSHEDRVKAAEAVSGGVSDGASSERQMGG